MDITIDTSAVMAVLLNEATRPEIIEATEDAELFAPHSLHWEIGNAFSALFRRGRIDLEVATVALASYEDIPVQFVDIPLIDSLNLAAPYDHYAYDAYMLECASRYNTALLTLDQALQRTARAMEIDTLEIAL